MQAPKESFNEPLLKEFGSTGYGTPTSAKKPFADLVSRYKEIAREKFLAEKGALSDKELLQEYDHEAKIRAKRDVNRPEVLDALRKFMREQAEITDGELIALQNEFSEVNEKKLMAEPIADCEMDDSSSWDIPRPTTRAQYIRHRAMTIKSERRNPIYLSDENVGHMRTISYTYFGFVVSMVVSRMLYHFYPSELLLWSCVVIYAGVLYFALQTIITPRFNNMDPTLLQDFARNINIIIVGFFSIIYLIQIAAYSYNPLLNDTTDQTFQFTTALIEIVVLFHGLLLDVLYYVPNFIKSSLLINNFCVIIFMTTVMYLDDADRPIVIKPEFRFIDLYTGTLTAILVMYAGMLFNHFIRRDGRTAILTRHYQLLDCKPGKGSFWMWVPLLFVAFYSVLTAIPSLKENVPLRICIIIIHPFVIYFFIFHRNLDLAHLPAPFDRVDMCCISLVPIIHIVLGFISRSRGGFKIDGNLIL